MRFPRTPKTGLAAAASLTLLGFLSAAAPRSDRQPPKTRTEDVKESFGSVEVADPYRWLEDQKQPPAAAEPYSCTQ